ncbi:hypothetical protein L228DRAFT_229761 [Xylona heveae TC161]|uniref:Integral membrane protein n=1 Tax=Xylona heveae (strain CBS 132557 / TC161) TaxID=1328760 RepID=A0A165GU66_XYLHT|nr:hypothetical protein L228DRAFT_229761 [Xylona heveae TC161]KZF22602.1 hypothetical protein L228DRAFT_229761 [Xylona heveae TC161]
MMRELQLSILLILGLLNAAQAHEHHTDEIPEGQAVSAEPLDTILWIHIAIQMLAFGIIFPTGMVLGIVRSRWHVPLQTVGAILSILGYFLGHAHKGRQFAKNVHSAFASSLMLLLLVQVVLGVYLKLHLEKGIHGRVRKYIVLGHGVAGKLLPIVSWVQMLFGGITALGFCRGDHLGQCLAHFIMGSAFIAYGIILTILLLVGQAWLKRTGRSQEFFDSAIITAWGFVNTFTEHRWGGPWVKNDLQHTSMGIIWWSAGMVGMWLSRKRDGSAKRNLIPGIVIFLTGWAMSGHPQELHLSTMIHAVFGYTLMGAGAARCVEIAFVLKDKNTLSEDGSDANSFQYLPPFLLYASGLLFMSATEEQMQLLTQADVSHVSYVLIIYSIAFLMFLFVLVLLHIYTMYAWSKPQKNINAAPTANGAPNGHARVTSDMTHVRDAEEFELEGLMSDEDERPAPTSTTSAIPSTNETARR